MLLEMFENVLYHTTRADLEGGAPGAPPKMFQIRFFKTPYSIRGVNIYSIVIKKSYLKSIVIEIYICIYIL